MCQYGIRFYIPMLLNCFYKDTASFVPLTRSFIRINSSVECIFLHPAGEVDCFYLRTVDNICIASPPPIATNSGFSFIFFMASDVRRATGSVSLMIKPSYSRVLWMEAFAPNLAHVFFNNLFNLFFNINHFIFLYRSHFEIAEGLFGNNICCAASGYNSDVQSRLFINSPIGEKGNYFRKNTNGIDTLLWCHPRMGSPALYKDLHVGMIRSFNNYTAYITAAIEYKSVPGFQKTEIKTFIPLRPSSSAHVRRISMSP